MRVTGTRRLHLNWVRILAIAATVYIGVGASMSAWHWWHLDREAHSLTAQLAVVSHNNAVLSHDLHEMRDPVLLRRMLTGQMPLPNAIWPNP